jgi:hypothetical protein
MEAGNLAKRNETKKQGSKEAKRKKELATEAQRHREKRTKSARLVVARRDAWGGADVAVKAASRRTTRLAGGKVTR